MTDLDPNILEKDFDPPSISLVESGGGILCDWSSWIVEFLRRYNSLDSENGAVNAVNIPFEGSVDSDLYIAPLDAETPDTDLFYNLPFRSTERQKLKRFAKPVIETLTNQTLFVQAGYREVFQSSRPLQLHKANKTLGQYEIKEIYGTGELVSSGFTYVECGTEIEPREIETLVDRVESKFSQQEEGFETGAYAFQYEEELRPERISAIFIGRE